MATDKLVLTYDKKSGYVKTYPVLNGAELHSATRIDVSILPIEKTATLVLSGVEIEEIYE